MKRLSRRLLPLLILLAASCNKDEDFSTGPASYGQEALALRQNPQEIMIGNAHLILSAGVSRRMGLGGDGATICTQALHDKSGAPIDTTIVLKQQYWIRNDDVWKSAYKIVNVSSTQISSTTDGAPRWPVGVYVDPVCEFEYKGMTYRLLGQSALVQQQ